MKEIILGKTGLKVTKPGMGCLPIQRCSDEDAIDILRAAYEGGIRFFDTANAYTDSERKIGLALSEVRDNIVISSKSHASTKNGVLEHIQNSLNMLKTDHVDIFQMHQIREVPDPEDKDGAYAGMLEAKERGWIDHIGFTSHRIDVAEKAVDSGLFETCQFPFSYISSQRDIDLAKRCKDADMGFIAMKGLAGGLLTDVRACQAFMNLYDNVVPIWGIQRMNELSDWLKAAEDDIEMDEATAQFIEKERHELSGSFCRGCGYCMPCSVGIEISNCARMNMLLRRSPWQQYMTQEWYAKMQKINECINCRKCIEKCPYELNQPVLLKAMLKDYNEFYEQHKDMIEK